jgi:ABC-type Fe3+-hydroxamate transport system substrate-binding protein
VATEHQKVITSTDQLGNRLELDHWPERIVSLVPSQTELLFDLGLDDRIVGVTRFCTHPQDKVNCVTRVGGTKNFDFARIDALAPDLIIGNKEENYSEGIERLQANYPVWMSDIVDLGDALSMIAAVGALVGRPEAARSLVADIEAAFASLGSAPSGRVAYLIWRKPYMVVGGENFIDDLLKRAGFDNVFADQARYPEVSAEDLRDAQADVIMLSSEPFPFTDAHREEFQAIAPDARVLLVNGMLFSWYGSRLREIPAYLSEVASMVS